MAIDHRIGNKVAKNLRREEATATRVDPYPYIGIVKNNYDPTRSGRLQVWIADLGGNEDDSKNWRTVSYASPFQGYTNQAQSSTDRSSDANSFTAVSHTYGMWMVPPDIGIEVIVLFIAGDPLRGYWVACVSSKLSHHMLPGLAGSTNYEGAVIDPDASDNARLPVAEFNENDDTLFLNSSFYNNPKPVHTPQYDILKAQGLDTDKIRGSITSSSQRETPSHVFGISTPGRPFNDPADDPGQYVANLNNNKIDEAYKKVKTRKGGHSFVMDDGAALGQDQLVRLRTAQGHQILMHDTHGSIYISHKSGESWIEMAQDGAIKMYSKGGVSVRTEGNMNFRADSNIRFDAGGSISMRAKNKIQTETGQFTMLQSNFSSTSTIDSKFKTGSRFLIDASAKISVKAGGILALEGSQIYQNSGGTEFVDEVEALKEYKLFDTFKTGEFWLPKAQSLATICTSAPTHEPYVRGEEVFTFEPEAGTVEPQTAYTGSTDATKTVAGSGVDNPVNETDIRKQLIKYKATKEIGPLSKDDLTAYYGQIGKSESSSDYSAVNDLGYVGKYQMGHQALIDAGYVKSSVTSNDQLSNPNSWTGKDGISDRATFLTNDTIQEQVMETYTESNYTAMVRNGAITSEMSKEDVGGMLATSHLLGATGAKNWRTSGTGADANGTTGADYFQKGKFAVSQLGPKVSLIDAG